jgi:uncharacterized membrane protein
MSGPLPAPQVLAEYERVLPGLAERIVKMAETQMVHRQGLEAKHLDGESRRANRGQYFGLAVALGGFLLSGFCVAYGAVVAAAVIASVDLVGLVSTFLYGTKTKQQELAKRARPPEKAGGEG